MTIPSIPRLSSPHCLFSRPPVLSHSALSVGRDPRNAGDDRAAAGECSWAWDTARRAARAALSSHDRARRAQAAGCEELARILLDHARWRARYALYRLEAFRRIVPAVIAIPST
jgi:hypothetical protein